jgi:HD superfamily phosphohydrolase
MGEDFRHKIIIDPVHGDIGLSKLETELIDTPTFQRLRRIKQLGFAYTVYPNARHSRFEHSLGVMHIMSRILESFRNKDKSAVPENDYRKLRIAALLHDIGHYPYSHLMEKIDWDSEQKYITKKGQDKEESVPPPNKYPKHDKLGEIVITRRKDIKERLENDDIDPRDIAALIKGQHQSILNLINASLDVDRLDYLVRDSLNTGLPYGKVDINYIVNNLELTGEKEVIIREKAKNSIEHMLMGRYFMFNTVYMHKTVFAFEEMIRRIVRRLWEKGKIYKSGQEIEQIAIEDSRRFLDFHDGYLDQLIEKYADNKRDKELSMLCYSIKLRQPPKLVYEVSELTMKGNNPSQEYTLLTTSFKNKVKDLIRDTHISEERWIFKDIKTPEFEKLHPFVSLAEAAAIKDSGEQQLRELVKVKKKSGEIIRLLEDKSSVLHFMSQLKPKLFRVYVTSVDDAKAIDIRNKIRDWLQG